MALSALVSLVVIALWASARLPEYLVALLFFAAVMVLQLAPAAVTFSGFASSAFWLVLSGFRLGTAIRSTGLADRLANRLLPHLAGSWPRLVGGVVAISYALAFVMPSNMGRITLLMPIVMALADRAGLAEGTRGRIGLALAVGFGTFQLSASILPANVPNLVMSGAAESAYGSHFAYLLPAVARPGARGCQRRAADAVHLRPVPCAAAAGGGRGSANPAQRRRMAADRAVGRHGVAVDDRQLARHRSRLDRVGGGLLVPVAAYPGFSTASSSPPGLTCAPASTWRGSWG